MCLQANHSASYSESLKGPAGVLAGDEEVEPSRMGLPVLWGG